MSHKFDYVIIGGGPAGCVLANFLSKSNKVALIDIASEKVSDESSRFFPSFITNNKKVSIMNKTLFYMQIYTSLYNRNLL